MVVPMELYLSDTKTGQYEVENIVLGQVFLGKQISYGSLARYNWHSINHEWIDISMI